jgi:hypothetical protein
MGLIMAWIVSECLLLLWTCYNNLRLLHGAKEGTLQQHFWFLILSIYANRAIAYISTEGELESGITPDLDQFFQPQLVNGTTSILLDLIAIGFVASMVLRVFFQPRNLSTFLACPILYFLIPHDEDQTKRCPKWVPR